MNYLLSLSPFLFARASTMQSIPFLDTLLGYVCGGAAAIMAVFLMISLAKDAGKLIGGNGSISIWQVVGKILTVLFLIGIVILLLNYKQLGDMASKVGGNAIDIIQNEAENLTNSGY